MTSYSKQTKTPTFISMSTHTGKILIGELRSLIIANLSYIQVFYRTFQSQGDVLSSLMTWSNELLGETPFGD